MTQLSVAEFQARRRDRCSGFLERTVAKNREQMVQKLEHTSQSYRLALREKAKMRRRSSMATSSRPFSNARRSAGGRMDHGKVSVCISVHGDGCWAVQNQTTYSLSSQR